MIVSEKEHTTEGSKSNDQHSGGQDERRISSTRKSATTVTKKSTDSNDGFEKENTKKGYPRG